MSRHVTPWATAGRHNRNFLRKNGPVWSNRHQQVIGSSPIAGSNRINNFHRSPHGSQFASRHSVAIQSPVGDRVGTFTSRQRGVAAEIAKEQMKNDHPPWRLGATDVAVATPDAQY
jgi:hypothetical protein